MKKKKLLSFAIAAALSLSCFAAVPVVSQAAEYTYGDFTYSLDGGCTITGYKGSDTNVVIPETVDGYDVLAIGQSAFWQCKSIKEIKIPNSVQTIGSYAFYECSSLAEVDLGNSVRELDYECFADCDSLTSIDLPVSMTASGASASQPFYGCDGLKTVTIASGGVYIPSSLFENCGVLQNISIPDGITEIGQSAFWQCKSIKEIKIPNSVQTIGSYAFYECSSLKEVVLSENLREIGYDAFVNCGSLKDYYDYSMEAKYNSSVFNNTTFLTIHGFEGSNAQKYANSKSITFVPFTEKQMFRLYNKYSGEHFYTSASAEKDNLVSYGWAYEGTAWIAPASSNTPVYRLYNPNSGEHHYTMKSSEKDFLVGVGWKDEGIGWYSDDNQGTALYRLYNPNATGAQEAGGHHYTKDVNEKNSLIAAGWRDEGIGWYGI